MRTREVGRGRLEPARAPVRGRPPAAGLCAPRAGLRVAVLMKTPAAPPPRPVCEGRVAPPGFGGFSPLPGSPSACVLPASSFLPRAAREALLPGGARLAHSPGAQCDPLLLLAPSPSRCHRPGRPSQIQRSQRAWPALLGRRLPPSTVHLTLKPAAGAPRGFPHPHPQQPPELGQLGQHLAGVACSEDQGSDRQPQRDLLPWLVPSEIVRPLT